MIDRKDPASRGHISRLPQDLQRREKQGKMKVRKQGKLTKQGITAGAIYKRVKMAGRKAGIEGLSPHDLRHTFAERTKQNLTKILQHAGGWNGPAMALRYQQQGEIANEGLVLED
jgi:integrase